MSNRHCLSDWEEGPRGFRGNVETAKTREHYSISRGWLPFHSRESGGKRVTLRYRQLGGCTYDEEQKEAERIGRERLAELSVRINEHTWTDERGGHALRVAGQERTIEPTTWVCVSTVIPRPSRGAARIWRSKGGLGRRGEMEEEAGFSVSLEGKSPGLQMCSLH